MKYFYNEFNPDTAEHIEGLIAAGAIPPGVVDARSITALSPEDLAGYDQCHFFAGIAGWSMALERAGCPKNLRIWTDGTARAGNLPQ